MKNFDYVSFFDDWGIEYITSGHHHCSSTFKWQTHCPVAGNTGSGFHLGVNPTGTACYKCGGSHSLYDLLGAWTHRTGDDIRKLISKYGKGYGPKIDDAAKFKHKGILIKPPLMDLVKTHENYLKKRGYPTEYLKLKYKLQSIMPIGYYGSRIYIPIVQNQREVSFTTRKIKDQQGKYRHCKDEQSLYPIRTCLYGIDDCQEDFVIICEGITDVWNFGANTVGIFGKTISDTQKLLLIKKFKTIFILLDPDAFSQSKIIKQKLLPYRRTVNLILKDKDPGELNEHERYELLQQIEKLK